MHNRNIGDAKMELNWNTGRIPRPGSATIRVTDMGWQGLLNPCPLIKDDEELFMDEYLSRSTLKALTGVDDLRQVKALEMRVDTRENSLGNFGAYLPSLRQLKLNNSLLASVRDLGTTLSHLQVLWMARCGLTDLDGISSLTSLKELYIAYNNISDLSQVCLLDHLEILDLEGNNIEDINQIQYLGLCSKLSSLTVEGNLICLKPSPESSEVPDYNYRAEVKKLIPHLKYLDEVPASQVAIPASRKMSKDWLIVKDSIKEGGLAEDISGLDSYLGETTRRPGSDPRPATAHFTPDSRLWTLQRPTSAGRCNDAHLLSSGSPLPEFSASDEVFPEDNSSDLTHGIGQVICGNPIKALHARRQKLGPLATNPFKLHGHRVEHSYDSGEGEVQSREDVFAELKAWREQHKRRLQIIQMEKAPQVLKITHSDEEKDEECSLSDSCEDELREICDEDLTERISLDSSCQSRLYQSSSDSLHALESGLPSRLNFCLVPSPPKCPSPASMQGPDARPLKVRDIRVRRLKIPNPNEQVQVMQHCLSRASSETAARLVGEQLAGLSEHSTSSACESSAARAEGRHSTDKSASCQPRRPVSGPAAVGSTIVRPIVDKSPSKVINPHQPVVRSSTKTPERFGLKNAIHPLTARAALQRLPSKPSVSMAAPRQTPES
ncbi:leucine-rich repeat-containing protein 56 [Alligator sinensis]|uniref:Leucine-rich repeat-containing protein 56 n=1 Tax=Alligator sinensis TaxID=38654 RepID=A0A3Q0G872_ALLSI|nr:leucine-rich repeat-containing protein 56 [Alligator sinensis]